MAEGKLNRDRLPPFLKQQLAAIEPSHGGPIEYFPCDVVLTDGRGIDRVFLVSESQYIKVWGIYPEQDRAKRAIDLHEVASVADSRSRLPAKFADKLYKQGESGMGYYKFFVLFTSGFKQLYVTGDAVDFISYPQGLSKENVKDVMPHAGIKGPYVDGPDYSWCLFSE